MIDFEILKNITNDVTANPIEVLHLTNYKHVLKHENTSLDKIFGKY